MKKISEWTYETEMAGNYPSDRFGFSPSSYRCGQIEDGVSIMVGDADGNLRAGFVLAYVDLLEMTRLAAEARKQVSESSPTREAEGKEAKGE